MIYPLAHVHLSNLARRRVTTLIETNALPLSYAITILSFRRYSRSKSGVRKIDPNFTDLHYKVVVDTSTDHVAKFRGDRPTDLGDPVENLTRKLSYRKDDSAMHAI